MKTNVIRILESKKIPHTTIEYNYKEDCLDAVTVAEAIGTQHETVFKTLVARNDKNMTMIFVIPGNFELNLKKAAAISNSKSIEMLKVKELLPVTGYIRGGCSPIGMKKLFPAFIDETAMLHEIIYISAGIRGMQISMSPIDLSEVIEGKFCDLT